LKEAAVSIGKTVKCISNPVVVGEQCACGCYSRSRACIRCPLSRGVCSRSKATQTRTQYNTRTSTNRSLPDTSSFTRPRGLGIPACESRSSDVKVLVHAHWVQCRYSAIPALCRF